jgi:peptidoglycan/LPS O-acetylase OafA/YrhL
MMDQRRYEVLDAWRGICALLVFLYHLGVASHLYGFPPIRHGGAGVDFFFVLSGFVIAHSSLAKLSADGAVGNFMLRRFGRIYPLHLATLLGLVFLEVLKAAVSMATGMQGGEAPFAGASNTSALIASLFLVQGLGGFDEFTWNGPSWSISTEFYTYLLFGLAAVLSRRRYPVVAALLVVGAGLALAWNAGQPEPRSTIQGAGLLQCVQEFFLGTLIYQLHRRWPAPSAWLEPLALALVGLVFFNLVPFYATPFVFGLFVYTYASERGVLSRAFRIRPLLWLGLTSYSIYLVHYPVLTTVNSLARIIQAKTGVPMFVALDDEKLLLSIGGPWAMDLLTLVISAVVLGVAALTYRWIEKPADLWFKNLARRRASALQSAPAA